MTTAIEQFKEAQHSLASLEKSAHTIRKQIESAQEVSSQYQSAQTELDAAKSERKSFLGMLHLGKGKPDTSKADKVVHQAAQRLDAMADARDGAEAAREVLQRDLAAIEDEAAQLAASLPELRYQAANEEVNALIDSYMASADETERKFASVAGSLMVLQSLRVNDAPPFAWRNNFSLEIAFPNLPFLNQRSYQGVRSHMRLMPAANDAKEKFSERLSKLGIV